MVVAKIGLSYNFTIQNDTREKIINEFYGTTTHKNFVDLNISPFPDTPYEIIIPFFQPHVTSREENSISCFLYNYSFNRCLKDIVGLSIGVEKIGFINKKLDLELRIDLSPQEDSRHRDTYTYGYRILYLNAKYRLN